MGTIEKSHLATLLALRAQLSRRREELNRKLSGVRNMLGDVERDIVNIENEISSAKWSCGDIPSPINGAPTKRAAGVLKAWAAVYRAIHEASERDGLPNALARRAIQNALPGVPDATCRSYLHRFSKRGHIAMRNGRWFLATSSMGTQKTATESGE